MRRYFENRLILTSFYFLSPKIFFNHLKIAHDLICRWELCSVSSWRTWCGTRWRTPSTPSGRPSLPPMLSMLSNGKDVLSMASATELADANLLVSCMESELNTPSQYCRFQWKIQNCMWIVNTSDFYGFFFQLVHSICGNHANGAIKSVQCENKFCNSVLEFGFLPKLGFAFFEVLCDSKL